MAQTIVGGERSGPAISKGGDDTNANGSDDPVSSKSIQQQLRRRSSLRRSSTTQATQPTPQDNRNSSTSPFPPLRRPRSRQFSRSSTDTILPDHSTFLPTINETPGSDQQRDGSADWHSISLVFVALPAIAGLFSENGGAVMTDALLLALGCLFLYWSVKWPWQWYHSAQGRIFVDYDPDYFEDDDDISVMQSPRDAPDTDNEQGEDGDSVASLRSHGGKRSRSVRDGLKAKEREAQKELQQHEILALISCFVLPAAVAYSLHLIRPYLSRPSGGLVSNSHLTLFGMAAEVKPVFHVFKLISARTLHLQKVVVAHNNPDETGPEPIQLSNMIARLQSLESRLAETDTTGEKGKQPEKDTSDNTEDIVATTKLSIQPQLDALNRAVRRYEKRATMQSAITESRLRDLDHRVNDALSLAAATSRMAGKSGIVANIVETIHSAISALLHTVYSFVMFPWKVVTHAYIILFGTRKKARPKVKRLDEKGRKLN